MSMLTPEQMPDFIATHDFRSPEDVQQALKGLFAETLQAMFGSELETHLGYPKHQAGPKPTPNPPSRISEGHRATAGTRSR